MLRRYAPLLVVLALMMLVATACIVRTGPSRGRNNSYRSAPAERHDHGKHKKHKHKHKKHR